ncbi:hypothetical protein Kisp02_34150 [Kineosporia sp. NBRC 101731]|nr:hypothetical protein Kisp02_34150 [Kineosporia sp. NBRC 101731]
MDVSEDALDGLSGNLENAAKGEIGGVACWAAEGVLAGVEGDLERRTTSTLTMSLSYMVSISVVDPRWSRPTGSTWAAQRPGSCRRAPGPFETTGLNSLNDLPES